MWRWLVCPKKIEYSDRENKFIELVMEGKSSYEAYLTAYPHSQKWKRNSVDSNASKLLSSNKIKQRIDQINAKFVEKLSTKKAITRMELLNKLVEGLDMAMGIKPTPIALNSFGKVTEITEVKQADLKALKGIADTIMKLEGFEAKQADREEFEDDGFIKAVSGSASKDWVDSDEE